MSKCCSPPPLGAISVFALCCCALTAQAINYVDPVGGNDDTAVPGSETLKYKTIQAAIDNCPANGTVSLADGTYDITTAVILNNGISLVGSDYKNCIIRQTNKGIGDTGRVINMAANTTISGITVTGGNHPYGSNWGDGDGTGILAGGNCTITHCCVSNNVAVGANMGGGGICIASGTIDHTLIVGNKLSTGYSSHSVYGSGIKATGATVVDTCLVANNGTVTSTGPNPCGGIYATGKLTLRNSTIAGNVTRDWCGGVNIAGNNGSSVVNCIFADNFAGEAVSDWVIDATTLAKVKLVSSGNFFSNQDFEFGTPSRSGDPCFIDAEAGDYRLGSLSPAVNFGTWYEGIADDLLGFPRGETPDAGCYERQLEGIVVIGDPAEYGAPMPGYGEHAECEDGKTYELTCPEAVTNGCVAQVCTGWRLKDGTGATSEGEGCAKSIEFRKACEPYQLTWLWERQFVAKNAAYVTPGGRGTRDGLTPENATGSISDAVLLAAVENPLGVGGIVYLEAGTYEIGASIPLRAGVRIVGATDGESVLKGNSLAGSCLLGTSADDVAGGVLENLVLTNCTKGCVSIAASTGDFTVTGCRFFGSAFGVRASSSTESRLTVTNCLFEGLKTTDNGSAGVMVSGCVRPVLVQCLFRRNSSGSQDGTSVSTCFTHATSVAGDAAVLRDCQFVDNSGFDRCAGSVVQNPTAAAGLRVYGCTFLRNSCTMRPGNETNGQRCPCLSVRNPAGGVYAYDSYFGYNTLTNTATVQNPQTASVLVCNSIDGNFMFVNCTFEHNRIWSTKDSGMIGTFKLGWGKQLGLANCVFNENDVIYHSLTTDLETRKGELNYGENAFAMGIFNCIFTHTAADYEHCHAAVGDGRQYCLVVNSDIKGFTNPTKSHWKGYRKGVTDGSEDPMLAEKVSLKDGLPAHGVSWQSKFRKGGEILRMGSNGIPYMYKEGGRYNNSLTNPWLPVLPCDTTITDAAAAELELTTQTPPMDDAFGAARREKWIAYGPLNAPPRGLMLLVR